MRKGAAKIKRTNQKIIQLDHYLYGANTYSHDFKLNKVYYGFDKTTGKQVLIKAIGYSDNNDCNKQFEQKQLNKIRHPNILNYLQQMRTQNYQYLIYDMPVFTLEQYLQKNKLKDDQIFLIWNQILFACIQLREKGFIHRCLHPKNIVMMNDNKWKITGFEHVTTKYKALFNQDRNLQHDLILPPDTLRDHIFNDKSVVWTLGVLLYILVTNKHPFENVKKRGQILGCINKKKISQKYRQKYGNRHQIFEQLISISLKTNINNRASLQQMIEIVFSWNKYPKNFQKVIRLKKLMLQQENKRKYEEEQKNRNKIKSVEKELCFAVFLKRIQKLLIKSEKNTEYQNLFYATQFYIKDKLLYIYQVLQDLKQDKTPNLQFKIHLLQNQLTEIRNPYCNQKNQIEKCQKQFKGEVMEYLGPNNNVGEIFLIRYQVILRNFISNQLQNLQKIQPKQLPKYEYLIYTIDFSLTLFIMQKQIIGQGAHTQKIWDFLELQQITKIAENPFEGRIDLIFQKLVQKSQDLNLFQPNEV